MNSINWHDFITYLKNHGDLRNFNKSDNCAIANWLNENYPHELEFNDHIIMVSHTHILLRSDYLKIPPYISEALYEAYYANDYTHAGILRRIRNGCDAPVDFTAHLE